MTRGDVRRLVQEASVERVRELLDGLLALKAHRPIADHEAFFKTLADEKLSGGA